MKNYTYIIILYILLACNSSNKCQNNPISNKDSLLLEKKLMVLKNWTFKECYLKSELETYKKNGKVFNDTVSMVKDLTEYYYMNNSDLNLIYIYEDINRKKLINKWLKKQKYNPFINPPDFPNGSLNILRSLDFYNSSDMKKYIDSVRVIELKTILNSNSTSQKNHVK